MQNSKLILLPALGADQELFKKQKLALKDRLFIPEYPPAFPNESIEEYADRWVERLIAEESNSEKHEVWIGGVSFGGMMALELARQFQKKGFQLGGIFLISAPRTSAQITKQFKAQVATLKVLPEVTVRMGMKTLGVSYFARSELLSEDDTRSLVAMVSRMNYEFFNWAAQAAAKWSFTDSKLSGLAPIYQIHGRKDSVIPRPSEKFSDVTILTEAAHLIPLTYADELNAWINRYIQC